MSIRRAGPGELFDFSYQTYNRTQTAVDYVEQLQQQRLNTLPQTPSPIVGYNATGNLLGAGYVAGIKSPRDDIYDNNLMLAKNRFYIQPKFELESITQQHIDDGNFALVQSAITDRGVGPIKLSGGVTFRIVIRDTGHTHATPIAGDATKLESSSEGPIALKIPINGAVNEEEITFGVFTQNEVAIHAIVRIPTAMAAATINANSTISPTSLANVIAYQRNDVGTLLPADSITVFNYRDVAVTPGIYMAELVDDVWIVDPSSANEQAIAVVRLEGSLPAATLTAGILTPGVTPAVVNFWERQTNGTLIQSAQQTLVYNCFTQIVTAGFKKVASFGGAWFVLAAEGTETPAKKYLADLGNQILPRPTGDNADPAGMTASTVSGITIYESAPSLSEFQTGAIIFNSVPWMTWQGWVEVQLVNNVWQVCGDREYGDLLVEIDAAIEGNDVVRIPNGGTASCTIVETLGPDNPRTSGTGGNNVVVHNPRNLAGWKEILVKWNHARQRYEAIKTNLPETGTPFVVSLSAETTHQQGDNENRHDIEYRARATDDGNRDFGLFRVTDSDHPYSRFLPDLGRLENAAEGLIYWTGSRFRLYDAREKFCVKVATDQDFNSMTGGTAP